MNRREFLGALVLATAALPARGSGRTDFPRLYEIPERRDVATLIHLTDVHGQLLPMHLREADVNIGTGGATESVAHLTGAALLEAYGFERGSRQAYAFADLDFTELARRYGRMGGFPQLATLVRQVKARRRGALVVDGGDAWQGSATALWTRGADMVEAQRRLGVEVMTGHWEFTYGAQRVLELRQAMAGSIEFVAQNIFSAGFGDRIFSPFVMRDLNGLQVAIIGQAYPYTPIANPRHLVADWTFGIHERPLQECVDEARRLGAQAVVLLSHNGVDVDLKLAARVTGIDAILGGHTHDPLPRPVHVANRSGRTLVANAGSNGKFLGVLDLKPVRRGVECHYVLLPVFSDLIEPDRDMAAAIAALRAPHLERLQEPLAVADALLFRRGNFNGSFDELILRALREHNEAPIAFSPGFRWGTALLPGETVTFEDVMAQTAITYPWTVVREMSGAEIHHALEDIADNLFNPDPYYRQGGDMVRTAGLTYACRPTAPMGRRITDLRLDGVPLAAQRRYRVAGWASVQEDARETVPVWELVREHLRRKGTQGALPLNRPRLL
jgi:sulfur-oxidizing protein SoxB